MLKKLEATVLTGAEVLLAPADGVEAPTSG